MDTVTLMRAFRAFTGARDVLLVVRVSFFASFVFNGYNGRCDAAIETGPDLQECFCGNSQPTNKAGWCDYACSGDSFEPGGGVNCMSTYKFKN